MMQLLIGGIARESRAVRFWRWLIDDLRSERRLLSDANHAGDERRLISLISAWVRRRDIGQPEHSDEARRRHEDGY